MVHWSTKGLGYHWLNNLLPEHMHVIMELRRTCQIWSGIDQLQIYICCSCCSFIVRNLFHWVILVCGQKVGRQNALRAVPLLKVGRLEPSHWDTFRRHWLSYCQQIAHQLHTQNAEGIYRHKYYTVTLKSRLNVTQDHWKRNHWLDQYHRGRKRK